MSNLNSVSLFINQCPIKSSFFSLKSLGLEFLFFKSFLWKMSTLSAFTFSDFTLSKFNQISKEFFRTNPQGKNCLKIYSIFDAPKSPKKMIQAWIKSQSKSFVQCEKNVCKWIYLIELRKQFFLIIQYSSEMSFLKRNFWGEK